MRKFIGITLIAVLVLSTAGCASFQKKFTRKKKEPKHVATAIYLQEENYQKKYSNEYYYKTHFTYWQTWHSDLLNQLGGNSKKVSRCVQEALSNLVEMKRYLKPEKQAPLEEQIQSLSDIAKKLDSGYYSKSSEGSVRSELEKIQRIVNNNFYFNKVKEDLVPDTVAI